MLEFARKFSASGRLRHAGIAIVLATLAAVIAILRPLDIAGWSLQSKLFTHEPSQEIVFFTDVSGEFGRSNEAMNGYLLSSLERLDRAGVELIVIDEPIQRSGSNELDQSLREALLNLGDKVVLGRKVSEEGDKNADLVRSDPFFEIGIPAASNDLETDFLGFIWWIEAAHSDGTETYPALWNQMAYGGSAASAINPSYTITASHIPRVDLALFARGEGEIENDLSGKIAVIGALSGEARMVKAPDSGVGQVPSSLIHIVAAETARSGGGQYVGSEITLLAYGLALLLGLLALRSARTRHFFYAAWSASFVLAFIVSASLGVRVLLMDPLLIGLIFGGFRAAFHFRRRHLYLDPRSKLPNFVALQRDLEDGDGAKSQTIVVAKIARLDAVFVSISAADQGRYLRQIAARLTLGDERTTIYYDGGKYLAFVLPKGEYPDLQSHLEGLRAIASQAVTVSQSALDVSMTIGADESLANSASKRISSAIAAADQAREAYRPVFIISDFEADSEAWDHSLQSRLENALSKNSISIKLQPQVDFRTGMIVGAEALARWVDEERGEIPPSQFILQCERVGRLDELTKRILRKSFSASKEMQDEGLDATVSVNVSAIQFVDHRIADLIERTLVETEADPLRIIIEMTESARVDDFGTAREIMERLKRTGIRFSIDDFGVASANLDALYQLPFDELKIDRMFVDAVTRSPAAQAIVANMVRLAKDMRITSVAEGIETREIFEKIQELGCDTAQGYYLARPQAFSQLKETLLLQRDSFGGRKTYG